jgi:DNA-binding response OmpR family regulator
MVVDTTESSRSVASVILVVEDEAPVRDLVHDVLALHGYTVLTAADGPIAVALAERHRGPIQLLLIDVGIPGLAADDVVRAIAAGRAGIKILYMSGYTDDIVRHRGLLRAGRDFLQKPFTVDALVAKVREVLDA